MRGRQWFYLFRPLFRLYAGVLRLLPARAVRAGLSLIRYCPGRLGIALRYGPARRVLGACGEVVAIFECVFLRNPAGIHIGDHVSIHPMCYLDGVGGIRIGSQVSIAHGCSILSFDHGYRDTRNAIRDNPIELRPVVIGNDVWIGCGARILSGVTIGDRAVVGAGAVVTTSLPPGTLAVGVPARVIRTLTESDTTHEGVVPS